MKRMSDRPLNSDNQPDNLDHLVDRALASYTPPEARYGLELRILASVAIEGSQSSRFPRWTRARAFAALLLLLTVAAIPVWIKSGRWRVAFQVASIAQPAPLGPVEHSPQTGQVLASPARHIFIPRSQRAHAAVRPPLQPQFGQSQPTKEELMLAHFAAKEPEMMAALVKSKPDLDTPITVTPIPDDPIAAKPIDIEPITVEPIQISSLNSPN
jgi:hypothetical protein